jgi:hypothetical protein
MVLSFLIFNYSFLIPIRVGKVSQGTVPPPFWISFPIAIGIFKEQGANIQRICRKSNLFQYQFLLGVFT